jgi:hypothetical protein
MMNITVFDGAYCYDINPTPGLMTNFIDEYYFPDNNVTYLLFTDSSDFVILITLMSLPIHSYRILQETPISLVPLLQMKITLNSKSYNSV